MSEYWIAIIIVLTVWFVFFRVIAISRRQMVIVSLLFAPFAVFDCFTTPSYWTPHTLYNISVGIEGVIFTFGISGIAFVIYQRIANLKDWRLSNSSLRKSIILLLPFVFSIMIVKSFALNIIYLFIIFFFLATVLIAFKEKLLFRNIVITSIIFSAVYFIAFNIWIFIVPNTVGWWNVRNISGVSLLKVPVEEVVFALGFGGFVGPLYQYLSKGYK